MQRLIISPRVSSSAYIERATRATLYAAHPFVKFLAPRSFATHLFTFRAADTFEPLRGAAVYDLLLVVQVHRHHFLQLSHDNGGHVVGCRASSHA